MKRLKGCNGSHGRIENDGFNLFHFGRLVNHETRREPSKWHNTTSKDKVERMHFGMQDEEHLGSFEKNLDEHFEKELNLWWAIT